MYFNGIGTTKDYKEAFKCYLNACNSNVKECYPNLADCYYYGLGTTKDDKSAIYYYDLASKEANKIKKSLERNLDKEIILGPSPANVFKVNNIYRFGIIIKYKKDDKLYQILIKLIEHYRSNNKVVIDIDFNPNHF